MHIVNLFGYDINFNMQAVYLIDYDIKYNIYETYIGPWLYSATAPV